MDIKLHLKIIVYNKQKIDKEGVLTYYYNDQPVGASYTEIPTLDDYEDLQSFEKWYNDNHESLFQDLKKKVAEINDDDNINLTLSIVANKKNIISHSPLYDFNKDEITTVLTKLRNNVLSLIEQQRLPAVHINESEIVKVTAANLYCPCTII